MLCTSIHFQIVLYKPDDAFQVIARAPKMQEDPVS